MDTSSLKEIIEDRTMFSKKFNLGNQKFRIETFSHPIHYLKENQWIDIKTEIKDLKQWEFTNGVTDNIFNVYFGDDTVLNNHLFGIEYTVNDQNKWINFKLDGAKNCETEITGENKEKFKFIECMKNIDLEYIVYPNSLKENIILKEKTDIRKFDFTIKTGGTQIISTNENRFKIIDNSDEFVVWDIENPYMIDVDGNISYGVKYQMSHNGEFDVLSVIIEDSEFLSRASYPVYVDPTVTVSNSNTEVMLASNTNSNSSASAGAWTWNTSSEMGGANNGYGNHSSAIYYKQIDTIKNLMPNVYITKAILSVYAFQGGYGSSGFPGAGGQGMYVNNVTSAITNNVIPTSSNDNFALFESGLVNKWIDIDFKQQLIEKGKNFNGLYFSPKASYSGYFLRSPYYSDVNFRPKLIIEYLIKPTLAFHDGNPDIAGFYSDGEGNVFREFDFGTVIAGQTTTPVQLFIRNLSDFNVNNLNVKVEKDLSDGGYVELSLTRNPFNPTTTFLYENTIASNQDISFYIRLRTLDSAVAGGATRFLANAYPS